nr:hypothetical protein [Microbispora cellulosiformans]
MSIRPGQAGAARTAMPGSAHPFAGAFLDGLSPAQAEVVRGPWTC